MANPLQRPDGQGISRTKVTALVAILWPFAEPYLSGQQQIPAEMLSQAAPYTLFGLAVWYIRAAIRGEPADLGRLLDGYHKAFVDRQELQETRDTLLKARDHLLRENRRLREQLGEPTTAVPASED